MRLVINCDIEVTEDDKNLSVTLSNSGKLVWSMTVAINSNVDRDGAYIMVMDELGEWLKNKESTPANILLCK